MGKRNAPPLPDPRRHGLRQDGDLYGAHRRSPERRKQAIVLIPEIALTYQTVMRFYRRFGERISVMNSRLSPGERFDQYERARKGLIDVMIGPRSALFTPFPNLGIIIQDEEHETSYQSETVPRYLTRETAVKRGELEGAHVVLDGHAFRGCLL